VCALAGPAPAGICGLGTYSYAGVESRVATGGVSAAIASVAPPAVRGGHVAGWVGVGGQAEGPDGVDAWLQVGLNALPDDTTNRVYYEVTLPGRQPVYRELRGGVPTGERHRFAVAEVPNRLGWWRAWVDGSPVSPAFFMPGSHGRWTAQVLGESWAGNASSGRCNGYGYSFGQVMLAGGKKRLWRPASKLDLFQDANYRLFRLSRSGFLAAAVDTLASRAAAVATPAAP